MKFDTIIIGAGLTGLTTAFYLKKAGKKVLVIEKDNRVGGVIRTEHSNGFTFETGPNTGTLSHPEVVELFEELNGLCHLEKANPEAKRRLIWKGSQWHALPGGHDLLTAITTPLFTFKDKLRVLGEAWRPKGTNPHETLDSFVIRRLGKSFLDYAVDPFVSGVYAGDPRTLVPKYALPKLYNLEQNYGSFVKGSMAKHKEYHSERERKATKEVFSAKGGLEHLINSLEAQIGNENFVLNASETTVNPTENGYKVCAVTPQQTYDYEAAQVITTVGAYALPQLLPFLSEQDLAPLVNLEYAKVIQVIVGYENWTGVDIKAFGGLVPTVEQKDILGVLFTSSFFENRAPQNGALLSIFIGGVKKPHLFNLTDDELKQLVDKHLKEMMKVNLADAAFVSINRYEHAIPQYTVTSGERFAAIERLQKTYPELVLAGNIRNGIGMADRIKQGKELTGIIQ